MQRRVLLPFPQILCLPLALSSAPALAADPPAPSSDLTATAAVAALHFPEVTQTRLENGLTVILEENHQSPFVAMQLRYDAGSRDDPPGKEGLASITQRLTMLGTKHVPEGAYEGTLDRVGAMDRGWGTTLDAISEWVTVPSNAIDSVLWLWSDQMGFFAPIDLKSLADARAAKTREREEKVSSVALGAVGEIVQSALYPEDHPYHWAPIASATYVATLDDVRAFHDQNLAPSTAVLALVGDFQSAAVLERIRTYFAPISAAPARGATKLAPAQLDREVLLDVAADVKAAEVWMDWRTPPFFAAGDAELDVGALAMSGTRVAALRWALVDGQRVATRVTARQMSHALGSDFRITATVAAGHTPAEVIASLDTVLDLVQKRGLNPESFAAARANTIVPYVQGLDRDARRAAIYLDLAMAHRDPRWISGDVGRYDALTGLAVNATMARWLTKGHRVVTIVTPDKKAPVSGILRTTGGAK
jgi:predicted Zn-dependent peptidase